MGKTLTEGIALCPILVKLWKCQNMTENYLRISLNKILPSNKDMDAQTVFTYRKTGLLMTLTEMM